MKLGGLWDRLWHQAFNQPYVLSKQIDQGSGTTVVLLHGIGRDSAIWANVAQQLAGKPYRVLAFDLLGFGSSPKPEWSLYNSDDHARTVLASLAKAKVQGKVIIAGHSMGCLIAARLAYLQPDLVSHLVLYEMPLYDGLPDKRLYRMRLNFYFSMYNRIIKYQPEFSHESARLAEKLAVKIGGLHVSRETWQPFVKSLQHTIMEQTAAADLQHIQVPMDIIFGTRDRLVIRGKTQQIFGEDTENIVTHTIKERHFVSPEASVFIAQRIEAAAKRNYADPTS